MARALSDRHKTAVLFATSQCTELDRRMGAIACLPKPYLADDVPAALRAIEAIADGQTPVLPDHMFRPGLNGRRRQPASCSAQARRSLRVQYMA